MPVLDGNLSVKHAPKPSAKYLEDKMWKIKLVKKHFSKLEDISKSAKNFLEKHKPKKDSSKTTISKVLSKISNKKKTSKQQCNICKEANISLKLHGM